MGPGAPAENEFGAFIISQKPSGGRKMFIDNFSDTSINLESYESAENYRLYMGSYSSSEKQDVLPPRPILPTDRHCVRYKFLYCIHVLCVH